MPDTEPRFEHDCASCAFLGQLDQWDLYYCAKGPAETVIARRGPAGDYMSGIQFGKRGDVPELAEAYRRAKERGLCA